MSILRKIPLLHLTIEEFAERAILHITKSLNKKELRVKCRLGSFRAAW